MVEFAVVLVVKEKLELSKGESDVRSDGIKFKTASTAEKARRTTNAAKVGAIEGTVHDSDQEQEHGGIKKQRSGIKQLGLWKALSLTRKIDFVAFFVFMFSYFIFNCAYWFLYVRL